MRKPVSLTQLPETDATVGGGGHNRSMKLSEANSVTKSCGQRFQKMAGFSTGVGGCSNHSPRKCHRHWTPAGDQLGLSLVAELRHTNLDLRMRGMVTHPV
ncbi:hypothetical protein BaRGS_00010556 [Batillaria attramentaria]|uniref:Uncharacterized protein n=1 Tax=Batillaria attramentaria TaxID=370345 RepID=A0ABD0LFN1_9CAEN